MGQRNIMETARWVSFFQGFHHLRVRASMMIRYLVHGRDYLSSLDDINHSKGESARNFWNVIGQPFFSDLDHIIPESFVIPVLDIP